MNFAVSFSGEQAIDKVLLMLPKELTHTVLSGAHFAAAKPLVQKEKLLAPEGPTGNLVDSIGATKMSFKRATVVGEVIVGPRRRGGYKGFAGHLVEFGTSRRETKRGANRGVMPKKPFAKPSFDATKGQVEKAIAVNIGKQVVRIMKKYT